MADGWARATATDVNNFGGFGAVQMLTVNPGQTVLKAWWNLECFYLDADVNVYPPGASILRAGVVWAESGLSAIVTPTPISQADADWLTITTVNPRIIQFSRATNVAWQINWGFPQDLPIKSMRRNDSESAMGLYLCYEIAFSSADSGFGVARWNCSLDALVRTPSA